MSDNDSDSDSPPRKAGRFGNTEEEQKLVDIGDTEQMNKMVKKDATATAASAVSSGIIDSEIPKGGIIETEQNLVDSGNTSEQMKKTVKEDAVAVETSPAPSNVFVSEQKMEHIDEYGIRHHETSAESSSVLIATKVKEMERPGESSTHGDQQKLSNFDACTDKNEENVGIYAVVSTHLYPLGTFKEQEEDRIELILSDSNNKWYIFSGGGDHYLTLEQIVPGKVIRVTNFKWKSVEERPQKFNIIGLNHTKRGILLEKTVVEEMPEMDHLGEQFKLNQNAVFSLQECIRCITSFTVELSKIQMKKETSAGDVLSLRFLTSDKRIVQLAMFGDQAQVEWNLIPGKIYRVSFAKSDSTNSRYSDAAFYGTPRTIIETVDYVVTTEQKVDNIEQIIPDTGTIYVGSFWFRDVITTLTGKRAVALDGNVDEKGIAQAVLVECPHEVNIENHSTKTVKFKATKKGHNRIIQLIQGSLKDSEKIFDPLLSKHRITFK